MSDTPLVHVKDGATHTRPLCGFDPGVEPMAWTSRESMATIATCPECVHEVLVWNCGACDGKGYIQEYDEEWPCRACDGENYLEHRSKK